MIHDFFLAPSCLTLCINGDWTFLAVTYTTGLVSTKEWIGLGAYDVGKIVWISHRAGSCCVQADELRDALETVDIIADFYSNVE